MTQNQLALDDLLEAKGGVCALINTSHCFCVDQDKRIGTDVMTIQTHLKVFHKMEKSPALSTGGVGHQTLVDGLEMYLKRCSNLYV